MCFKEDILGTHFTVEPIQASFGARIYGVRLASISDEVFGDLYQAWLEYGLLIFEDENLRQ